MVWSPERGEFLSGGRYGGLRRSYEPPRLHGHGLPEVRNHPWVLRTRGEMMAMALPPCQRTQFSFGSPGLFCVFPTFKVQCGQTFTPDPSGSLHGQSRSVLGESFDDTPMVVPTRAWLDEVRRFMRRDYFFGRGSTQRGLTQSLDCNNNKVSVYRRTEAIWRFEQKLRKDPVLREIIWTMSGSAWSATANEHRNVMATPSLKNSAGSSQTRMIAQPQRPHRLPLEF